VGEKENITRKKKKPHQKTVTLLLPGNTLNFYAGCAKHFTGFQLAVQIASNCFFSPPPRNYCKSNTTRKSSMFITDLQKPITMASFRKYIVLAIVQKKRSISTVVCSTGSLQLPVS